MNLQKRKNSHQGGKQYEFSFSLRSRFLSRDRRRGFIVKSSDRVHALLVLAHGSRHGLAESLLIAEERLYIPHQAGVGRRHDVLACLFVMLLQPVQLLVHPGDLALIRGLLLFGQRRFLLRHYFSPPFPNTRKGRSSS